MSDLVRPACALGRDHIAREVFVCTAGEYNLRSGNSPEGPGEHVMLLCRLLGHKPSLGQAQLDPANFSVHSFCRRCGIPLVQQDHASWESEAESAPPGVPSPSGAASADGS